MATEADATPKPTLRARVTTASLWAIGSNVGSQALRFASNLILSRLLFPEAFGLMALTNAVLQGLEMFSDLGVGPAVIQAKETNPRLLDVAWTLGVVRGVVLFAILLVIAYPVSLWYGEAQLVQLLPALGVVTVIRGFASPTQYTLSRELKVRQLVTIELSGQVATVIVSVVAAMLWQSVWALVFGGWVGAAVFTYYTFALDRTHKPRWCWDKEPLRNISSFGRWVMLSTMLTYALYHGDRLILGTFMSMAHLGVYQIAQVIARAPSQMSRVLAQRILFPLYAEIGRETTPELLSRLRRIRLAFMGIMLPPLWILACFGDFVVKLLWDDRYAGAGWMVQALCAGEVFTAHGVGPLFMARGEPWVNFAQCVFHASLLFPAMWLAGSIYGPDGLIYALCASPFMMYLFGIWTQLRYRVWMPWLDLLGLGASAAIIGLGLWARRQLGF